MTVIQMADVEARQFTGGYTFPNGTVVSAYLAEWESAEGPKGKYFNLTCPATDDEGNAGNVYDRLFISAKALPNTKGKLLAMGAPEDTINDPAGFEIEDVLNDLINERFRLRLGVETYISNKEGSEGEERQRNVVREVIPDQDW